MKLRVSLCEMTFSTAEVEADDVSAVIANPPGGHAAKVKFSTAPLVHRIERFIPDGNGSGEGRWEEIDLIK